MNLDNYCEYLKLIVHTGKFPGNLTGKHDKLALFKL